MLAFLRSIAGASGFRAFGYIATAPLALVLLGLSWWPIAEDLTEQWQ